MSIVSASSPSVSRAFSGSSRFTSSSSSGLWLASGSRAVAVCSRRWSVACTLKPRFRATAELVEDKESTERRRCPGKDAVLASALGEGGELRPSWTFLNASTEEELLSGLRKEKESGRLPPRIASKMEEVYQSYRDAVLQSGNPHARELILLNMGLAFDRILLDVKDPFNFESHHKAVREPFDYYKFGQNYIRPLLDFRTSYVGNISIFSEMEEKLKKGHNIVLISNHQSEADPAVISLLLEATHPYITEKLTYVAGDRVLTNPVCKPFSMGRNLICVYSKKHMDDTPELVEMKMKANTKSLKEMALLFRTGSQILWIAPSGGRDRPDPSTGEWYPAPFDASSVDIIRRVTDHPDVPGHIYPLALLCYEIMPPPPKVEKQIGERRLISFHGVGLSVAPEMKYEEAVVGNGNPAEALEHRPPQSPYHSHGNENSFLLSSLGSSSSAQVTCHCPICCIYQWANSLNGHPNKKLVTSPIFDGKNDIRRQNSYIQNHQGIVEDVALLTAFCTEFFLPCLNID